MCFCLKISYLIYNWYVDVYWNNINIQYIYFELLTLYHDQKHYNSCPNKACLTSIFFLCKAHLSLLVLRYTGRYFSTLLRGAIFKQWNHHWTCKRHKNAKNMAPNRLWKGHLFTMYFEWLKFIVTLCLSEKAPWVLIWRLQIHFSEY